jgi:hypothetical protein
LDTSGTKIGAVKRAQGVNKQADDAPRLPDNFFDPPPSHDWMAKIVKPIPDALERVIGDRAAATRSTARLIGRTPLAKDVRGKIPLHLVPDSVSEYPKRVIKTIMRPDEAQGLQELLPWWSNPKKDAAAKQAQGVNEREREFYRNRPGVAGVRSEQEKRRQQQLSLQAKRLEDAGYQPRADGKGWTKDQTLWAKPAPKPAPVAAAPETRWGKFTPDEFHKETDVYLKLKKKYANDPAMLKHMYGTQGYKDWETAGKAYMSRSKPKAPATTAPKTPTKPSSGSTFRPRTPPARPSPGSAFPPRRPPAVPSVRSGAAVPAVPKTVTASASPDLMQQLQHIVAEKEAKGAISKPKYKAAPNSVTTVKRYPQREDKDDAVGSSTIKYINRKGRPYVRPKK